MAPPTNFLSLKIPTTRHHRRSKPPAITSPSSVFHRHFITASTHLRPSLTGARPPSTTPTPPTNKRSYANIVQNLPPTHFQHDPARAAKKIFQEESLQEIGTVSKYKGLPSITYTEDETSQLSDRLKFALIGKFSHGLPNLNFLRQRIVKLGLRGSVNVGPLNFKHVLIMLSNEEDYSRIWLRGEWSFDGFPMRIFKWTADFRPTR
ncbi:hypothetical protein Salat_2525000 [Sesamum alatum]|uniref:DUF4283 domain-containing protein n=1 Tax=Sesamum alatum TaxID=300844 RepID=A0AAE1XS55_9LAMI|nr:hypothetical protein Salat_2525000 [Sesamum alatum]